MTSALLLNAGGATVLVGCWVLAVVHVYRSLAADERRSLPAGREHRVASGQTANGRVTKELSTLAAYRMPQVGPGGAWPGGR